MDEKIDYQTVLIVDDEPVNIKILSELLSSEYAIRAAKNGEKALKIINSSEPPDLVLLDIVMPGMDGYEVCKKIKSNPDTHDIPVIFLTAKTNRKDEEKCFTLGASDFITKPISPPIVHARVNSQMQMKKVRDFLVDKNEFLEKEVSKRTAELSHIQDVTIFALASLAETRDNETGGHIKRTQHYVRLLAEGLSEHPRLKDHLTEKIIDLYFKTAPLHDIGKVGIPDHILLKPGKLTAEEFEIMKSHTRIGRNAILNAEKFLKAPAPFLFYAREMAFTHHEKWNGTGYPMKISGDHIPLSGRIMAVADVYDALITERVYKSAVPHDEAVKIIKEESGKHFDPAVVDVFLDVAGKFRETAGRYSD